MSSPGLWSFLSWGLIEGREQKSVRRILLESFLCISVNCFQILFHRISADFSFLSAMIFFKLFPYMWFSWGSGGKFHSLRILKFFSKAYYPLNVLSAILGKCRVYPSASSALNVYMMVILPRNIFSVVQNTAGFPICCLMWELTCHQRDPFFFFQKSVFIRVCQPKVNSISTLKTLGPFTSWFTWRFPELHPERGQESVCNIFKIKRDTEYIVPSIRFLPGSCRRRNFGKKKSQN